MTGKNKSVMKRKNSKISENSVSSSLISSPFSKHVCHLPSHLISISFPFSKHVCHLPSHLISISSPFSKHVCHLLSHLPSISSPFSKHVFLLLSHLRSNSIYLRQWFPNYAAAPSWRRWKDLGAVCVCVVWGWSGVGVWWGRKRKIRKKLQNKLNEFLVTKKMACEAIAHKKIWDPLI